MSTDIPSQDSVAAALAVLDEQQFVTQLSRINRFNDAVLFAFDESRINRAPKGAKGKYQGGRFMPKYKSVSGETVTLDPKKKRARPPKTLKTAPRWAGSKHPDPPGTKARPETKKAWEAVVAPIQKKKQSAALPYWERVRDVAKKLNSKSVEGSINLDHLWPAIYYRHQARLENAPKNTRFWDIPEDPPGTWFGNKYGEFVRLDRDDPPEHFVRDVMTGKIAITPGMANIYINIDPDASHPAAYHQAGAKGDRKWTYVTRDEQKRAYQKSKWELLKRAKAKIPALIKRIKRDMGKSDAHACLYLLASTGVRVDSLDKPGIFGGRTLQRQHISRTSDGDVLIDFPGKDGVRNTRLITADPDFDVEQIISGLDDLRGKDSFTDSERERAWEIWDILSHIAQNQVVYNPALHEMLSKKLSLKRPSSPLFPEIAKKGSYGAVYSTIREESKAVGMESVGGQNFTPHNLRHAYATRMYSALQDAWYTINEKPDTLDGLMFDMMGNMSQNKKTGKWRRTKSSTRGEGAEDADHFGILRLTGFSINDTHSPVNKSYIDPDTYADVKKGVGGTWQFLVPIAGEAKAHKTGAPPKTQERIATFLKLPVWAQEMVSRSRSKPKTRSGRKKKTRK